MWRNLPDNINSTDKKMNMQKKVRKDLAKVLKSMENIKGAMENNVPQTLIIMVGGPLTHKQNAPNKFCSRLNAHFDILHYPCPVLCHGQYHMGACSFAVAPFS